MKNEEWRDVVGYEGLYQVSDQGNISEAANGKRKQAYGFIWKCI